MRSSIRGILGMALVSCISPPRKYICAICSRTLFYLGALVSQGHPSSFLLGRCKLRICDLRLATSAFDVSPSVGAQSLNMVNMRSSLEHEDKFMPTAEVDSVNPSVPQNDVFGNEVNNQIRYRTLTWPLVAVLMITEIVRTCNHIRAFDTTN